jgi:hypothetical protein
MAKLPTKHLDLLKQELNKWEAFNRLNSNPDYLNFLKPLLQSALNNIWPDPAEADFDRKYIIQFARAKAYKEIFDILETSGSMIDNIRKQIVEPEKNYSI